MAYEVLRDEGYSPVKLALFAFANMAIIAYLLVFVISLH
jgi:hypothetical protein